MGRTNPYVSKEQEFAFFRFSFDAGRCFSLHHISVDPALNICHVYQTGPDQYNKCHVPFRVQSPLFKTCDQSSIGTPNNYFFICQQSITTLKEYVGISHVSISVPGTRLSHSTTHSPIAPERKALILRFISDHQRGCDMGPYCCSSQGSRNYSYR